MSVGVVVQAVVMFAVTNVDDILLLALYFGRATGEPGAAWRVVVGQYLGFLGILVASVTAALGAGFLPEAAIPYLGLLPLTLGLRAAWQVWRGGGDTSDRVGRTDEEPSAGQGRAADSGAPSVLSIAVVTFANGGDNIGVYVPVFAATGRSGMAVYCVVFLALVAVWCLLGRVFAGHPTVARVLARWGHILLPIVLIVIGVVILVEDGALSR